MKWTIFFYHCQVRHHEFPWKLHLVGRWTTWRDDVIKWKHFPRYWPFVREIHQSPVYSPHKGQWRGKNGWVNNRDAGDLRRHSAQYDVIVMISKLLIWLAYSNSEDGEWFVIWYNHPIVRHFIWCFAMYDPTNTYVYVYCNLFILEVIKKIIFRCGKLVTEMAMKSLLHFLESLSQSASLFSAKIGRWQRFITTVSQKGYWVTKITGMLINHIHGSPQLYESAGLVKLEWEGSERICPMLISKH